MILVICKIFPLLAIIWIGYLLLKESLHYETPAEKLSKFYAKPSHKKVPKWYSFIMGCFCLFAAIYAAIILIFRT